MSWLVDTDVLSEPLQSKRAIARRHNLTIVTRNTEDFNRPGLRVFNPFGELRIP